MLVLSFLNILPCCHVFFVVFNEWVLRLRLLCYTNALFRHWLEWLFTSTRAKRRNTVTHMHAMVVIILTQSDAYGYYLEPIWI